MCACLSGCGSQSKSSAKAPPKKPTKPLIEANTIRMSDGSAVWRSPKTMKPMYEVAWQSGSVDVSEAGASSGAMQVVKGTFMKSGLGAGTFSADSARADREASLLKLEGHVNVYSKDKNSTMTCDRVEYWSEKKLIKASGNVRVVGKNGTLGTLNEVWTDPDLKRVATPELFFAK